MSFMEIITEFGMNYAEIIANLNSSMQNKCHF